MSESNQGKLCGQKKKSEVLIVASISEGIVAVC